MAARLGGIDLIDLWAPSTVSLQVDGPLLCHSSKKNDFTKNPEQAAICTHLKISLSTGVYNYAPYNKRYSHYLHDYSALRRYLISLRFSDVQNCATCIPLWKTGRLRNLLTPLRTSYPQGLWTVDDRLMLLLAKLYCWQTFFTNKGLLRKFPFHVGKIWQEKLLISFRGRRVYEIRRWQNYVNVLCKWHRYSALLYLAVKQESPTFKIEKQVASWRWE